MRASHATTSHQRFAARRNSLPFARRVPWRCEKCCVRRNNYGPDPELAFGFGLALRADVVHEDREDEAEAADGGGEEEQNREPRVAEEPERGLDAHHER